MSMRSRSHSKSRVRHIPPPPTHNQRFSISKSALNISIWHIKILYILSACQDISRILLQSPCVWYQSHPMPPMYDPKEPRTPCQNAKPSAVLFSIIHRGPRSRRHPIATTTISQHPNRTQQPSLQILLIQQRATPTT